MRVLSIDLPWSKDRGAYGFAWIENVSAKGAVRTAHADGGPRDAHRAFSRIRDEHGRFDILLVDQPLGGATHPGCRDVERAFGNSVFAPAGPRRIQCPRFQPGGPHGAAGELVAQTARDEVGSEQVRVVESFPQLSVPSLLFCARDGGFDLSSIDRLKAHKSGHAKRVAQAQLLAAFSAWTGCTVDGSAVNGNVDAVDAVLGLLPLLELFSSTPRCETWAQPVWLHANPPGGPSLPARVCRTHRRAQRGEWLSALDRNRMGPPGIRTDGLVALQLPDWGPPRQPSRIL